ncbi:MAG: hypothetical protein M3R09_11360, partial [Actinomycetota bacterium]|nr:hypothetical protein [Actinomycetota bacterium]
MRLQLFPAQRFPAVLVPAQLFAQISDISDTQLARICGSGEDGGSINPICATVLRVTNNRIAASLAADAVPALLKIIAVLIVAWLLNRVLKRAIKRFTR